MPESSSNAGTRAGGILIGAGSASGGVVAGSDTTAGKILILVVPFVTPVVEFLVRRLTKGLAQWDRQRQLRAEFDAAVSTLEAEIKNPATTPEMKAKYEAQLAQVRDERIQDQLRRWSKVIEQPEAAAEVV